MTLKIVLSDSFRFMIFYQSFVGFLRLCTSIAVLLLAFFFLLRGKFFIPLSVFNIQLIFQIVILGGGLILDSGGYVLVGDVSWWMVAQFIRTCKSFFMFEFLCLIFLLLLNSARF